MSDLPFKTEVALAFDPANASDELKEVFADPIARYLWLAIKIGHIVNQHFDDDCLAIASWIHTQKDKSELERDVFIQRTARNMCGFIGQQILGSKEMEFAKSLITYLLDGGEIKHTFQAASQPTGEGDEG